MRRITGCLQTAFPPSRVEECEENLASMSKADCEHVSNKLGRRPYCFSSADLRPQRRKRYFWCSWPIHERESVCLADKSHYVRVHLQPRSAPKLEKYLARCWEARPEFDGAYPTLTRPKAVAALRWHTLGDNTEPESVLTEWRLDRHRRPPLHDRPGYRVVQARSVATRFRQTEELEALSGFDREYTVPIWKAGDRKLKPEAYRDARESGWATPTTQTQWPSS